MSIFAIGILSVLFITIFVIAVRLVLAMSSNVKTGQFVREQLAKRIEQFRFGKMLEKRGVDKAKMIHQVPLTEIEQQIHHCQECNETKRCDDVLQEQSLDEQVITFCPNSASIAKQT